MMCDAPEEHHGVTHACGKCFKCNERKTDRWRYRLRIEDYSSVQTYFCTWTSRYAQNPEGLKHLWQRYMKRVRRHLKRIPRYRQVKLRYFTVLERGEKNGRLHLHSLIFLTGKVPANLFRVLWIYGYNSVKKCEDHKGLWYVSKYVAKAPLRS